MTKHVEVITTVELSLGDIKDVIKKYIQSEFNFTPNNVNFLYSEVDREELSGCICIERVKPQSP